MDNENQIAPTEDFHVVNRYLGWGEPKGGIWFVGLEEADVWTTGDIDKCRRDQITIGKFVDSPEGAGGTNLHAAKGRQIRAYTCKIVQPLSVNFAKSTWRSYQEQQLWRPGCGLLQINLYPIGRPHRNDWSEVFKTAFGFSTNAEYEAFVQLNRFKEIASLWEKSERPPVIAFGKEGWHGCKSIFGLGDCELLDGGKVESYHEQRVILAPFFSYWHMSNIRAKLISDKLKEWGVSIP